MTAEITALPEGTHTVVMGLGDLNGIMRGKRIPAAHWPQICEEGAAFSSVLFAMDMTCDVWDSPYANFDNGFPDFHMYPMTAPVALPWEPGVALCFGRAAEMTGEGPMPLDPRQVLVDQVTRAAEMGIEVKVGAELEFYLLDPDTNLPRDQGISVYGLDRAAELEHVLGPIRRHLDAVGIPVEQSNPEYAAGQVEVNLRYDSALLAADRVVMFRSLVKQLAAHHGYKATFMPKPFHGQSGNGFHCHYSMWGAGKNLLAADGELSETGRHVIGGLQRRMAEMSICGSATVNGYRRRVPYSFCPINTAWGVDNRTAGLRVIDGSDAAVRVEKRDAGADCNPYLLMATDIAAALDGIDERIAPTEAVVGSAYKSETADPIPTDLPEAIRQAQGSDWLRDVLGDVLHQIILQQAERELAFFNDQVTPMETARYLDRF